MQRITIPIMAIQRLLDHNYLGNVSTCKGHTFHNSLHSCSYCYWTGSVRFGQDAYLGSNLIPGTGGDGVTTAIIDHNYSSGTLINAVVITTCDNTDAWSYSEFTAPGSQNKNMVSIIIP